MKLCARIILMFALAGIVLAVSMLTGHEYGKKTLLFEFQRTPQANTGYDAGSDVQNENGVAVAAVQKAVDAHGGAEALKKLRVATLVYTIEGAFPFMPGAERVNLKVEETYQLSQRQVKKKISGKVNDKEIALTWAIDGDRHWYQEAGKTEVIDNRLDTEAQFRPYWMLEQLVNKDLRWGSIDAKAKHTEDVSAFVPKSQAAQFDGVFYFDKERSLLTSVRVKRFVPTAPDSKTQLEVIHEWKLEEYKEIDGVKLPMKLILYQDGKKLCEICLQGVRFFNKLDVEIFSPPK